MRVFYYICTVFTSKAANPGTYNITYSFYLDGIIIEQIWSSVTYRLKDQLGVSSRT